MSFEKSASLMGLLTCHTHGYQHWPSSGLCACPIRLCGERLHSFHLPPRLVSIVYIQTCRSRNGGSLAEDLGNQGWCVEAQPFSLRMMPTGFLCLCCFRSAVRQVRKRQTEAKRKWSWATFSIKSSLFDDGICIQYSNHKNFLLFLHQTVFERSLRHCSQMHV